MSGQRKLSESKMTTLIVDFLLIHPPYHRRRGSGTVFPLGLGYLAAVSEVAGFKTSIIDCAVNFGSLDDASLQVFVQWFEQKLKLFSPRIAIGVGPCTTPSVRALKIISQICKKLFPEIPIIYGGPLASIPGQEWVFFEEFSATAIVPGDGEVVINELLTNLRDKGIVENIHGVITPSTSPGFANVIKDLNNIPFPIRPNPSDKNNYHLSTRRDLFVEPFANIMASRGCPYKCSFCVSGTLRQGQYHRRSVDNIINEIDNLTRNSGVKSIIFYDDTFFPSRDNLERDVKNFIDGLDRLPERIVWQIEMRTDIALAIDSSLAKLLFEAGCRQINLGIEKADAQLLKNMDQAVSTDQFMHCFKNIRNGAPEMRLTGTFILGGPGETRDSIKQTIDFSKSIDLLFAHFYPLELYPGTKIYTDVCGNHGSRWWYDKIMSDDLPWGKIVYEDDILDRQNLLNIISDAYKSFYQRDSWRELAKLSLGDRFPIIEKQIAEWFADRFDFKKGN